MLLKLALWQAWREKNHSVVRILAAALWLAVFSLTTLGCLAYLLERLIARDAASLLGADLILESSSPIPAVYRQQALEQGMRATLMQEFFSMLAREEQLQLAAVVALDNTFPLRGELIVEQQTVGAQFAPPRVGEIWLEPSLALKLKVKQAQEISVGNGIFKVNGWITQRPLTTSMTPLLAPLAYINAQDLPQIALLKSGARVTYRLLLAGTPQQLQAFHQHFNQTPEINWITPQSERSALSGLMVQARHYLAILLFIQVLLSAIAIAICAHQYSLSQQKMVALLRCLGARSTFVVAQQMIALSLLALCVITSSIAAGYGVVWLIQKLQPSLAMVSLRAKEGWLAALLGGMILWGFAFPPLNQLRAITAMRILQVRPLWSKTHGVSYGMTLLGMVALLAVGGQKVIPFHLAIPLMLFVLLTGVSAWGLWALLARLTRLQWKISLCYLVHNKWQTIMHWVVFTLVFTLLLLLQIIQHDFMRLWQAKLPASAPNYFFINIEPQQIDALQNWFHHHQVEKTVFYPMVSARLMQVNEEMRAYHRPLNISWVGSQSNSITSTGSKVASISVEEGFAKQQQLKLGDILTFQIEQQPVKGRITQFRQVEWASFQPNFFIIFPPKVLEQFSHSYITSIYLKPEQSDLLPKLISQYPEISIVDIQSILTQSKKMLDKLSFALQGILMGVLGLGVLILYASLAASLKERIQQSALLQILGASRTLVVKMLLIEFCLLGLFSGIMASLIAQGIAQRLSHLLSIELFWQLKWIGWGMMSGVLSMTIFGMIGARAVFQVAPWWLLRQK